MHQVRCVVRYLHVVEPRQNVDLGLGNESDSTATVWPFRRAFKGVFISAGGHDFVRSLLTLLPAYWRHPGLVS
jgi:hypothetical protein